MKIYIASDHGGFPEKRKIIPFLEKKGYAVEDLGPYMLNPADDYPDYAIPLAKKVAAVKGKGIVICRNGQGVCIAANKVRGVLAVTGFSKQEAKTTRQDDNANVLCVPADYLSLAQIKNIIITWLTTEFSGKKRHKRRLEKVRRLER